jgi:hypothetical protein
MVYFVRPDSLGKKENGIKRDLPGTGMHLVHHHVFEFLIVDRPKIDKARVSFTSDSRGQIVLARVVETSVNQNLTE